MKNLITLAFICASAHVAFSQNFGVDNPSPQEKLHVNGNFRVSTGVVNSDGDHMEIMAGVRSDDNSYEWIGFYSGSTRQGIILYDGAWTGANNLTNEFSLTAEGSNLLTLNTQANHIALMAKGGNVGVGTTGPGATLDVQGASGIRIGNSTYDANLVFGNNATWKNGIRVYDNGQAEMRIWTRQPTGEIVLTNGYDGDGSTVLPTDGLWVKNNNVGIGNFSSASIGFKLHVPSGYIGTDYINTTDNTVTSGVTGIMVKAGDNYHRTATAAAIQAFIGSAGADNLGNHLATTTLNLQGNNISRVNDIVCDQNYGAGLVGVYASTRYQNVFSMGAAYRLATDGTTSGNLYGIAWTHTNVGGQSKSGLGHQALFMDNGVTQTAIGIGIWTNGNLTFNQSNPTISAPSYFVAPGGAYFNSGTVYCEATIQTRGGIQNDASSYSGRVRIHDDIHVNGWMRTDGNTGWYSETYAGGWYMVDGTWIRSYNSRNVYIDQVMRADGGVYANDLVRMTATQVGQLGQATACDFGLAGVTVEQGLSEGGGFHADGDQANIWSPGDGDRLLRVHDEDLMGTEAASERWYVNGSGTAFTVSDINKKQNIKQISGALSKVLSVSGYTYEFKKTEKELAKSDFARPTAGLIAQEVEKAMPELVQTDVEGNKFMNYDGITPYLVESIKEQQKQIENIKVTSSDFGSIVVNSNEMWVKFNDEFTKNMLNNSLPVVTLTSNKPDVQMYIVDKNNTGFKVKITSPLPSGLVVDYIAMVHKNKLVTDIKRTDAAYFSELAASKGRNAWDEKQIKADVERKIKSDAEVKKVLEKGAKEMALPADFKRPEASSTKAQLCDNAPTLGKFPVIAPVKEHAAAPESTELKK